MTHPDGEPTHTIRLTGSTWNCTGCHASGYDIRSADVHLVRKWPDSRLEAGGHATPVEVAQYNDFHGGEW